MSSTVKPAKPSGRSVDGSTRRAQAVPPVHGSTVPPDAAAAIVSYFVDAAALLGIPKSVAAIYGICFASAEPLSHSDIHARLELSAGSISQGLKLLREVGALRVAEARDLGNAEKLTADMLKSGAADTLSASQRVSVSASPQSASQRASVSAFLRRRGGAAGRFAMTQRYVPDLELRKVAVHWLEKRLQGQLAAGRARVESILGAGGTDAIVRARLAHLQNWHDKADAALPLAKAFLKLT